MEPKAGEHVFTPYVGEAILSPNRRSIINRVKNIVTQYPSFAKTAQKRYLGPSGRMVKFDYCAVGWFFNYYFHCDANVTGASSHVHEHLLSRIKRASCS